MKHILVNFDRCLSCHSCELACGGFHSKAGSAIGAAFAGEKPPVAIKVVAMNGEGFPMQCRHCTDSPCVRVCPVHALSRNEETGTVACNTEKCLGCMMCVMVCPFGAIHEGSSHKIVKCDLCDDKGTPSCVAACPTHALAFEETKDFADERRQEYIVGYTTVEER